MVENFDRFYLREFPAMVALACAVSGSRLAAEDLAQEALTRAYRSWSKIGEYDKPGAWLRRVTINLSLSARRRLASETRARLRLGPEPLLSEAPELHDEVWEAMRKLPGKQRAAVALHYLEDLPVASVADAIGCAESTAKVHLHRGRTALARVLEESR